MKKYNLKTGQKGEELAAKFLERKGYQLVDKNFRTRFGEIDLIVRKGDLLVFVEIKCRRSRQGEPEWQVNKGKMGRVKKMAQVYLVQKRPDYEDLRLDVVCLVLDREDKIIRIRHYENVRF